jgi:1,2-diacylglycerol 3-beta-glucosyltransferase
LKQRLQGLKIVNSSDQYRLMSKGRSAPVINRPNMLLFTLSILLFAQTVLLLPVIYLLFLTWAARRASKYTPSGDLLHTPDLLILIPAHNEEQLLPACLESIHHSDYPAVSIHVHVIADNCSDRTAEIASAHGVSVHLRMNQELIGKGYALRWAVERLAEDITQADGIVILDADSVISPNFFRVMAARLERGERVIQAYYAASAPEQSPVSSLRYAALAVLHYLRPLGRMVLGGSAGLKGNGMVFTPEIIAHFPWPASLTEDIEYHMTLLLAGERVTFAPDAEVQAEMPVTLAQSRSQHDRWERGRLAMARRYVPELLTASVRSWRAANRRQALLYLDAAMEHLIPPFSILAGLTFAAVCASLVLSLFAFGSLQAPEQMTIAQLFAAANLLLGLSLLSGQAIYLLNGLLLVGASAKIYRSLLFAPVLIIWKIWQVIRVARQRSQQEWVRTARNEG